MKSAFVSGTDIRSLVGPIGFEGTILSVHGGALPVLSHRSEASDPLLEGHTLLQAPVR